MVFRRVARSLLFATVAGLGRLGGAEGQTSSEVATPLTLHVYENLLQTPVVVLSSDRAPIASVGANRFSVSLNSGQQFPPTHVRLEGDDPISLSILVDLRSRQDDLSKNLGKTVTELGRSALESGDRLSIYFSNTCMTRRVLYGVKPDFAELESRVDAAISEFRKAGHKKGAGIHCNPNQALWNGLAFVVGHASLLPGRRVILALSNDPDGDSQMTWLQVKTMATHAGVAIFGLETAVAPTFRFDAPTMWREDKFQPLCELTGGLVFTATGNSLNRRLSEFVTLLRNRYIVEFPRSDNLGAGEYSIQISISKFSGFIRPAGISVPIADLKLLNDPNTIKPDPALALPVGSRKALQPPPH